MIRRISRNFAARCARIALAVAILGLGIDASVAAGKAILARNAAESVSSAQPFILAIGSDAADKQNCREVVVEIDDGYGVRGTVTRTVCRKVL